MKKKGLQYIYFYIYVIVHSGILSLHLHEDGAKFWSTQLLNVLQSFPLVKILPLYSSESYSLSNKNS